MRRVIREGKCMDCGERIAVYDDGSRDPCLCYPRRDATPAEKKAIEDWKKANPYPNLHSPKK